MKQELKGRLGYWQGRVDVMRRYKTFSLNWLSTFLLGVAWGLVISLWLITLLK